MCQDDILVQFGLEIALRLWYIKIKFISHLLNLRKLFFFFFTWKLYAEFC